MMLGRPQDDADNPRPDEMKMRCYAEVCQATGARRQVPGARRQVPSDRCQAMIIILPLHGRLDHRQKNDRALCTAIWTLVEKMILPMYGRLEPRRIDGVCMAVC